MTNGLQVRITAIKPKIPMNCEATRDMRFEIGFFHWAIARDILSYANDHT